eukprot:s269_g9.t1
MQDIGFFASVEDVGNHSIRLGIVGRRCPESLLLAMTAADEAGANGKATISREMGPPVSLGITDPISLGKPTQAEEALTEQLLEEISVPRGVAS